MRPNPDPDDYWRLLLEHLQTPAMHQYAETRMVHKVATKHPIPCMFCQSKTGYKRFVLHTWTAKRSRAVVRATWERLKLHVVYDVSPVVRRASRDASHRDGDGDAGMMCFQASATTSRRWSIAVSRGLVTVGTPSNGGWGTAVD